MENCSELTDLPSGGCNNDYSYPVIGFSISKDELLEMAIKDERYEDAALIRDGKVTTEIMNSAIKAKIYD